MGNSRKNNIRILVADDDLNVIDTILECLASIHPELKPVVADDPQKALELVKSGALFDLVFIDFVFSGSPVTGVEIFTEMKKAWRGHEYAGVLIVGCGTTGLFVKEKSEGLFTDFIEKPFSGPVSLKEKIISIFHLLMKKQEQAQ